MAFKDHFSGHAGDYAQARPTYPDALFAWIAGQCARRELVWDAGCGNGQASLGLSRHFRRVHATDPSEAQIAAAPADVRVQWRVEPAERCSLPTRSADLVTVAQAYHWFDQARFCAEAKRVLRPEGIVALWTYGLSRVSPKVDDLFLALYDDALGLYWPPERRHVENGYRSLPFPFEIIPAPRFEMRLQWTLPQYLAYLSSWSASQRHLKETGRDAVAEAEPAFVAAWGDPQQAQTVSWPLSLRVGRMPGAGTSVFDE